MWMFTISGLKHPGFSDDSIQNEKGFPYIYTKNRQQDEKQNNPHTDLHLLYR